jgi:hypothetical protein
MAGFGGVGSGAGEGGGGVGSRPAPSVAVVDKRSSGASHALDVSSTLDPVAIASYPSTAGAAGLAF